MSISSNYPAVKPTLLLDFANTKVLDPRITFTRASIGTYYDGETTAKAEENLLVSSQDFNSWAKAASNVTVDTIAAPDGTTTADKLYDDTTASAIHYVGKTVTKPVTSLVYTASVYAKAAEYGFVQLTVYDNVSVFNRIWFNLSTGAVGSNNTGGGGFTGVTSAITSVGNGWYRCSVSFTSNTTSSLAYNVHLAPADGTLTYTGDGASGIYIWGAQLEQRSAVSSYTPTTTIGITNYNNQLMTAASGVPRFDHNPLTGESLGLLIEESRANVCLYSDDFTNAAWINGSCIVRANTVVAPDGNLTADLIVENTTASQFHFLTQIITKAASSITYTQSIYAKSNGRVLGFSFASGSNGAATSFNLATGTIYSGAGTFGTGFTAASSAITSVGNGWYRCSLTVTTDTATSINVQYAMYNLGLLTNVYTGDGWSGYALWGAQVEIGGHASSYIPAGASFGGRQPEVATMSGTNFSSWFSNNEGTIYSDSANMYAVQPTGAQAGVYIFSDGAMVNYLSFKKESASSGYGLTIANAGAFSMNSSIVSSSTANQQIKCAVAYKANDFAASANAAAAVTDTAGQVPILNTLAIGMSYSTGGWQLNGTIKKLAYYPERLTNTQLQALTTI
jgi:hypothetical protein